MNGALKKLGYGNLLTTFIPEYVSSEEDTAPTPKPNPKSILKKKRESASSPTEEAGAAPKASQTEPHGMEDFDKPGGQWQVGFDGESKQFWARRSLGKKKQEYWSTEVPKP